MLLYFSVTLFVSALLLFLVEPMVGKMVLPQLGGTPAVWNTCLVFFQAALLLGYLYAHLTSAWLSPRRQVVLHLGLLLLPFLALPINIAAWGTPPVETNPIPWLFAVLSCTVGPAFLVVSASAPLLQRWFASTEHPAAKDPYFLYAASNLGSMVALLGYPLLVEPQLRLSEQSWIWMAGYAALGLLIAGSGVWMLIGHRRPAIGPECSPPTTPASGTDNDSPPAERIPASRQPITLGRRMRWIALSAVPSSLLLGFTTYLTTDIAAIPLLWVAPLAIYLLTFILVFARRPLLPHVAMVRLLPLVLLVQLIILLAQAVQPFWLILPAHLLGFFLAAMVCHGELAADRPDPAHLTEFYLHLSLGGVLGGLFNALVAPLIFDSVAEYPLMLVAACFLMPRGQEEEGQPVFRGTDLLAPLGLAAVGLVAFLSLAAFAPDQLRSGPAGSFAVKVLLGVLAVGSFMLSRRPLRFGLCVATMMMVGLLCARRTDDVLYATRSFFGVHRVISEQGPGGPGFHKLVHGNTSHGLQSLHKIAARRLTPLSYYHPTGPLGQVFAELEARQARPAIGVVGLGTGSIASYLAPGQSLTYYEIDPSVVYIAQNPEHFTFLSGSKGNIEIVLGDGRLTLAQAADGSYGLIIVDAFSSDAIPLHLITREALALYLSKLTPDGLLAFHISNRYLDLEPVLGDLAGDARLACRAQLQTVEATSAEASEGKSGAHYIVLSRSPVLLTGLAARDARWRVVAPRPGVRVWTDDYSNILSVLK